MSIEITDYAIEFVASGSTNRFPVPFPFIRPEYLIVEVDGVVQTLTTDYSVEGMVGYELDLDAGSDYESQWWFGEVASFWVTKKALITAEDIFKHYRGTVIMVDTPASGASVKITRSVTYSQPKSFSAGQAVDSQYIEFMLDKLTLMLADAQYRSAITAPEPENNDLTIPSSRASSKLTFSGDGKSFA